MSLELDVFVGNSTIIDIAVYHLWLDGYTGLYQNCRVISVIPQNNIYLQKVQ